MENLKRASYKAIALTSIALMVFSLISAYPFEKTTALPGDTMSFTTGEVINFQSAVDMSFWSGVSMGFTSGIIVQFVEMFDMNGILEPCDVIQLQPPFNYMPRPCEWWEVLDPQGNPTGIEFHIDGSVPFPEYHIDMVYPGPIPYPYPPGAPFLAEKKIDVIEPCQYYVVHWPSGWYPAPCSWWEIMDPETLNPTGVEFHVDLTNESCEFHIDEMINGPYILPWPWHMIEARRKVTSINPCDWFYILDLPSFNQPCTWWEVLDPYTGEPTGLEFHIDIAPGDGTFHVDETSPAGGIDIPMSYTVRVRQKITTLEPCSWFRVTDLAATPKPCTWWRIVRPEMDDVEFHVDESDIDTGLFHIDTVLPSAMEIPPNLLMAAEKKFVGISPCDWFQVKSPQGHLPTVCSWWRITWPPEWAGVEFHVDSTDGIDKFHIDLVPDPVPTPPTPPPWNVTAEEFTPGDTWYYKGNYVDYVPSGMPDFDQRQWGTYIWQDLWQQWSHCGPVAVANSLWWLDSEYEPGTIPPPTINDGFPLVQAYGQWDDHDAQNVPWLVEHLAYLMDTDGLRTGLGGHSGTDVHDMEAGLAHYLSWTGVNPQGDVNGDGIVDPLDEMLVLDAYGSSPGAPNWDLAADIFPASITYPPFADNYIDMNDLMLVQANMGMTGLFYEHTVMQPDFFFIEEEVKKCQDVVLLVGYWYFDGGNWYREPGGHYVTVAGVDSINVKLALSDPVQDAFESGLIPEGRIPVPHGHPPPEPPYVTHNDAQYVSQDIYNVTQITPPWPPCPGGNLMLVDFASWWPAPPFFAVIESAVVTSPLGTHDVAVTDVTTSKTGCLPMPVVCEGYTMRVNATAENKGNFTETFNVTAYAVNVTGSYVIGEQQTTLNPAENTTLTFTWNTAGFAYGNYTVSAYAWPVPNETNTGDNTFVDGVVKVVFPGDLNDDGIVDYRDINRVSRMFGKTLGDPEWDPNSDIVEDGIIDYRDINVPSRNFGKTRP